MQITIVWSGTHFHRQNKTRPRDLVFFISLLLSNRELNSISSCAQTDQDPKISDQRSKTTLSIIRYKRLLKKSLLFIWPKYNLNLNIFEVLFYLYVFYSIIYIFCIYYMIYFNLFILWEASKIDTLMKHNWQLSFLSHKRATFEQL